jgi:SEC-C motif-containing protein
LENLCPCCSGKLYEECCELFHSKKKFPKTAEELMRSRYAAFAIPNGDYLWETTLPNKRKFHHKTELENWGKENTWTKLEIIQSSEKEVEFKAYFTDKFGKENIHHERSTFKKVDKKWYYVSGKFLE